MSGHKMKLFALFVFAILLLQAFAEASSFRNPAESPASMDESGDEEALHRKYQPRKINCKFACSRRCRKASRKKICLTACKACCMKCHCVPPGTYGNKGACPCYASLKTHGHKPKCP